MGGAMKKITMIAIVAALLVFPLLVYAMETVVEIRGPEDITRMKAGIEKSIPARCIAKGIDLSKYDRLTITIAKPGESISFDAILKAEPSKAFHKDLKNQDGLSATIDEMIDDLFGPRQPVAIATPPMAKDLEPWIKPIDLPFTATSITTLGDTIFISDRTTIYILKDDKPMVWWKAPGRDEIFRLYSYKGSIIALTKHWDDAFLTYRITDGKTAHEWLNAVVPMGDGLISAVLKIAPDNTYQSNRWTSATLVEGTPPKLPLNTDIIAIVIQDLYPKLQGPEIIDFNSTGRLAISSGKETIWQSETIFEKLPLNLEQEYVINGGGKGDSEIQTMTEHYNLPPRIMVVGRTIITIDNGQGLVGVLSNVKFFKSSRILGYTWTGSDFEDSVLAKAQMGYFADIAVLKDRLLALIIQEKGTMLTFTVLKKG
jgi:hypothetical protein